MPCYRRPLSLADDASAAPFPCRMATISLRETPAFNTITIDIAVTSSSQPTLEFSHSRDLFSLVFIRRHIKQSTRATYITNNYCNNQHRRRHCRAEPNVNVNDVDT
ncbi:hypothetical protein CH63R_01434 [Colletotrichum higginsianum IMI 349063]|uniref:Uncharacterized protein n=1 Tax=Colletotrichum higginsianum (strain IMI 349063) TaxID=759273 RepID=A0A1B7YWC7_COLHI|nr:hypothetical protein CH63R_01434 [Colletotrichum higginsianum IMI 349063]OBR16254.1 hypothetical protein CH63R_01434 [Colletotrichum higginsianum IMI 349063]